MEHKKKITILINQQPYHFDEDTLAPDDFRGAVGAPSEYEVWLVEKNPDPEGQLPDDDVQITGPVQIKSGQRYRVVPPGTFGSAAPEQLEQEVETLKAQGRSIELVVVDGFAYVVFNDHRVPARYNKKETTLVLRFPMSYPNGRPDMFWTDADLLLANGGIPKQAEVMETHLGKPWRRFSWHPQNWTSRDNMLTYLEFVDTGLLKATQ